jgi:uncharacterized damage-inducible protein DinB
MHIPTLRLLFEHNDFASEALLAAAGPLSDAQLDRPFEIGPGSLRATLYHLFVAEWLWLRRWHGVSPKRAEEAGVFPTVGALADAWRAHAADRSNWLASVSDADLTRDLTYTNLRGDTYTSALGHQMIHVATHGVHHRAQAANMLRHLGVEPPSLDFIMYVMSANPPR